MAQTRGQDALPRGRSLTLRLLQLLACGGPANGRADFAVLAPSEPVLAVLGKDAKLPCHLSLNISAEDMELRCYRAQPCAAVHVHRAGRDGQDKQMARYRAGPRSWGRGWPKAGPPCGYTMSPWLTTARSAAASGTVLRLRRPRCGSGWQAPSMEVVLPLALAAMGLSAAGITCLFWKCQRKNNRKWMDEEGEGLGADKQGWQASRNGDPTFQGWGEDDVINVSPSLDPDSTSPRLALSKNRKSVRQLFFAQELPEKPGWFDQDPCMLGLERFLAGRYYWEVQVELREAWSLGVSGEPRLEGKGSRGPPAWDLGPGAVQKEFWALTFPRDLLHPTEPLHRVGILLDCDAGTVSFYSAHDRALIYMFSGLPSSVPL
ncbi:hypothetical protein MC885_002960 [Smutsia gigantea]|nr:hypothetical protein MC885_002960 [Smutsia gigantea]